jgi:isoamylase
MTEAIVEQEIADPVENLEENYKAGSPFPQGATWDGEGVNFALFSEGAEAVEICFFDRSQDTKESRRVRIRERTNGVWHIYVPGIGPGQLYGYRVYGPYDPENGVRFNPNKLLLDPYAKAIGREITWDDALFGYTIGHEAEDLSFDERDSAAFAPLAIVTDESFDWEEDKPLGIPWHDTVIYEAHVKGLTMRHPDVPEEIRGTYAAIGSKPIIDYLTKLGITAIELLPIQYFADDRHLQEKGLHNYWGYNTLGFFAPHRSYAASKGHPADVVREFREMVKALHKAGIEVILDVVYNHTAEGNERGPTLSFRGIDNKAYYRTVADQPRYYMDFTGCGNTLNMVHPHSLQLLMDSLRYWVTEMHVDGFRFDLAAALARSLYDVDQLGAFFTSIYQDPTLATTKLIAEPWDLGMGGYQVGKFPVNWTEWNGKYRDSVRKYWKGEMGMHGEIAMRLAGSSDLYEHSGRLPSASINFITAHDGFTLNDLVSYNEKHNEANGEDNRDGANDNESWNCGAEGPTDDPGIIELRERQKRNFLATLLLSQGVPMICAGDEISRTQGGNNNGYCQDTEISWHDWNLDDRRKSLLEFTSRLINYRRKHPNFHRRSFYELDPTVSPQEKNVQWLRSDGQHMEEKDWQEGGWMRTLGMLLLGTAPEIRDNEGTPVEDHDFLILLNSHHEDVDFALPKRLAIKNWSIAFDTARPDDFPSATPIEKRHPVRLTARSVMVLRHKRSKRRKPHGKAPENLQAESAPEPTA